MSKPTTIRRNKELIEEVEDLKLALEDSHARCATLYEQNVILSEGAKDGAELDRLTDIGITKLKSEIAAYRSALVAVIRRLPDNHDAAVTASRALKGEWK